jgi:hypothetical protein
MTPEGWKGLPLWVLAESGIERVGSTIEIPYRLPDGGEHARRIVHDDGRRWWRPSGRGVALFGLELLWSPATRKYRSLAITEGESDALALRAFARGDLFDVVGVPGATAWRPEWSLLAEGYDSVYVFGDGDDVGRRFAWRVVGDIPGSRFVELPEGEDVRSLVQGSNPHLLFEAIAQSEHALRLRKAFHLARDLETCEALLRGDAVPLSRLDSGWVERYGLREAREVAGAG